MAEVALGVVGVIANIIALIDFSIETYERVQKFRDDVKLLPKAFQDVNGKLPLLKFALQKTEQRASKLGGKEKEALEQSLRDCHQNIKDLSEIFKRVLPTGGASRLTRGWKAVSSFGQDKNVEAINKAMTSYVGALTLYNTSDGASVTQIIEALRDLGVGAKEPPRKPLFMVCYQKEQEFIGRTMIMDEIEKRFGAGVQRVAIAGIGGVGKSRIAIEYCYQFRRKQPDTDIFWVHGGNKVRLEAAYKEIATKIKMPGIDEPNANTLKLVSDWLSEEENGPWLMVLDNADDPEVWTGSALPRSPVSSEQSVRLAGYVPRGGKHGSVLINTRNTQIAKALSSDRKKPIEVSIFGTDDAVALLRSKISEDDEITEEHAIELAESLDFLSLAITQAAAYLDENDISVAHYLELVRSSKAETSELLSHENYDDNRDPDIQNSVFQTWKISFDQISRQFPRSANILSLMAMLDRQAISVDLLRLDDEKDLDFINAIQKLKAYPLIAEESKGKIYSMHRIVELSIRWYLETQKTTTIYQEKALSSVHKCFPPDGDYAYWSSIEVLNPHVQIVLGYAFTEECCELQQARLMYVLGYYESERGLHSVAVQYLSDSVKLCEKNADSDKDVSIDARHFLAFSLGELGRYEEAKIEICRAIEMQEKNRPEKPDPRLLGSSASILGHQGKFQESESLFQEALELSTVHNGPVHTQTLTIMNNLAVLYEDHDRFSEAEILSQEVLAMKINSLGVGNPSTLVTMGNLASVLGKQRKFEKQ